MRFRRSALIVLVALSGVSSLLSGATTQMDVKDIRPGMVGIGHTVFDGTHVEETWAQDEDIPALFRMIVLGPRAKMLDKGCAETLARLKAAAEA